MNNSPQGDNLELKEFFTTEELHESQNTPDLRPVAEEEDDGEFYSVSLLNEIIKSYESALNDQNDKYEIKYNVTLTTHKVPTKEGNKDVAYLRLEKAVRSKQAQLDDPNLPAEMKLPEWQSSLVHTEAYPFKNLQERVNPKQLWKDYLFQSCIARLCAAGLEYAELLHRMKKEGMEEKKKEDAGNKLDLVITDQLPRPLNEDELKYKEEIAKLRAQG